MKKELLENIEKFEKQEHNKFYFSEVIPDGIYDGVYKDYKYFIKYANTNDVYMQFKKENELEHFINKRIGIYYKEVKYLDLLRMFGEDAEFSAYGLSEFFQPINELIDIGYQSIKNRMYTEKGKYNFMCFVECFKIKEEFKSEIEYEYLVKEYYPEYGDVKEIYTLCLDEEQKNNVVNYLKNKSGLYPSVKEEIAGFIDLCKRNIDIKDIDKLNIEYDCKVDKKIDYSSLFKNFFKKAETEELTEKLTEEFKIYYDGSLIFDNVKELSINLLDNLEDSINIMKNGYKDINIKNIRKENSRTLIFDVEDEDTEIEYIVDLKGNQGQQRDSMLIFKSNIEKIKEELDNWKEYEESMNISL